MVQQLGLWLTAEGLCSIAGQGTKILQTAWHSQKKVSSFYLTLPKYCWELNVSIHIWYFLFKSRKLYTSLGSSWLTTIRWIIIILKWIITSITESIELKKKCLVGNISFWNPSQRLMSHLQVIDIWQTQLMKVEFL